MLLLVLLKGAAMSLSPSFVCAVLEKPLPLFIFHKKAFMLMRPLLKTICCRFNSVLKPQSASIMRKGRQGVRGKSFGGLSHANLHNTL